MEEIKTKQEAIKMLLPPRETDQIESKAT